MKKLLKTISIVVILVCLLQLLNRVYPKPETQMVIVTAAHLDERDFEGYTQIYTDTSKDIAIYYDLQYTPNLPLLNTSVEVEDLPKEFKVVDSNEYGFYIECKDSDFKPRKGLSGRIVYQDDKPIGFISKTEDGIRIFCVAY